MNRGSRVRIGVLFGGISNEHDVSRASAASVVRALSVERYEVVALGIGADGRWHRLPPTALAAARAPAVPGRAMDDNLAVTGDEVSLSALTDLDVVFPVLHGRGGEDGAIQGLLETVGVPYVGAGPLAASVGMDKVATKRALIAHGVPVAPWISIDEQQWSRGIDPVALVDGLDAPWFVKPANSGSSIGITRVDSSGLLPSAIDLAFGHDGVVIIEAGVPNARELECGVLGGYEPEASVVGEVQVTGGWFDYEQKYHADADPMTVPAPIPAGLSGRVRELSVQAFQAIGGWGLARVDFLYDPNEDRLVVNELNTLPGFTAHSMYPKVWAASGVDYPDLLERLVALAFERHDRRRVRTEGRVLEPTPGRMR